MTDKELLELAAKAAGYGVRWHVGWQCFVHERPFNTDNPPTVAGQRLIWSPLTDDGDALRLVVKLHLCVDVGRRNIEVLWSDAEGKTYSLMEGGEKSGNDVYIATRRAIVRAAAEIGQKTPIRVFYNAECY